MTQKIKDMKVGDIGFCVPWAFDVLPDGSFGIKKNQFVEGFDNSARLRIGRDEAGFWVSFQLCPEELYRESIYQSINEDDYFPVTAVAGETK